MLSALHLSQFRCFDRLSLELNPGMTVFSGENAQGKTSILEAVCVLLRLQSPRTSSPNELIQFGKGGFAISGTWAGQKLRLMKEVRHRRQLYHFENELARSRDYLDHSGLVVWMGNQDVGLISGGGGGRRRYLDFMASQIYPEYRLALRSYETALRARNRLLKEWQASFVAQIDAYSEVLVGHGRVLIDLRQRLVEQLQGEIESAHRAISESRERLSLAYVPAVEGDLAEALAERSERDRARGTTTVGPHRDDLAIEVDDRPAARYASEGQQRTIALALKLGQLSLLRAQRERHPILLIDDVFGELDARRREALTHALPVDCQQLLTTTSLRWLPEASGRSTGRSTNGGPAFFEVAAGTVKPWKPS